MVVVAIIAILATLLSPLLFRAREKARRSACVSNLRNIGSIIRQYAGDNNGLIPPSAIKEHNNLLLERIVGAEVPSSKINSGFLHLSYIALHNVNLLRGDAKAFKCPSRTSHDVSDNVYNANLYIEVTTFPVTPAIGGYGTKQDTVELSYPYFVNDAGSALYASVAERSLLAEANYDGETSIARDRIINHGYDFGNVLYGDGHVDEKVIQDGSLGVTDDSENSWLTFHNKTGFSGHASIGVVSYTSIRVPFQGQIGGIKEQGTISWYNNEFATQSIDETQ